MNKCACPLSRVRIAAPCPASWDEMFGNGQVRFCGQCKLNVYNLSAMTKEEAEKLIRNNEGRLCIRYYRRADGTILTDNCPVGLRAIKQKLSRIATAAFSATLSFFAGLGMTTLLPKPERLSAPAQMLIPLPPTPPIKQLYIPEPVQVQAPTESEGWMMGGVPDGIYHSMIKFFAKYCISKP